MSNGAVIRFLNRNRDNIRTVIASNPFRRHGVGGSKRVLRQFRHSGVRFSLFLAYSFFFFPLLLKANNLLCKLMGRASDFIPIKAYCRRAAIDYHPSDDVNDRQLVRLLRERDIDLIITCFFDQILGSEIISVPRQACLNVHPGLLPECRGVFPEFHTAAGKCTDFGFTIHAIDDAAIDTGRVLLKRKVVMSGCNSLLAISRRLLAEGLAALEEVLTDLNGRLEQAKVQGAGNYYSFPTQADVLQIKRSGFVFMGAKDIVEDISRVR